ncbi:hypothetical protein KKE45_01730 [Patescibacteria group bacterium]|nr:hypothetical protein [Patescibacteria group bacterium]
MKRKEKLFVVFLGCVVSLVLSVGLMYWVAEKFFFDKFFYQKSVEHGYWIQGKSLNERDFGKRSEDLIALDERFGLLKEGRVLGDTSEDNDVFTVAVIGDSYVWGPGVRFEDTVTQVLEKKLNKIGSVEVLSFARSGNSILDYLFMYDRVSQIYDVDLYVFVLVNNDVILNRDNRLNGNDYGFVVENCSRSISEEEVVYDLNWSELSERNELSKLRKMYLTELELAWQNPVNLCVMKESMKQLPRDRAVYLITNDCQNMTDNRIRQFGVYKELLKNYDKDIIDTDLYEILEGSEKWGCLTVSEKESHPPKLVHGIYADILYKKIVENNEYGFN